MKTYSILLPVLVSVFVFAFCVPPAYAAPSQQTDDPVRQCAEGYALFLQGKYTEALPLLEAGFNGRKKASFANPEDLGLCAFALGRLDGSSGNPNGALEAYQVALQVFQASQNRKLEGVTLNGLGAVYRAQGQFEQAQEYDLQALVIVRELGDRKAEGATLANLGNGYFYQGQYAPALDYYQQALIIAREIGDQAGESVVLNGLGLVYYNQGQSAQALDYYQQALVIVREMGNRDGESTILHNLGWAYQSQGQSAQALDYYQQALVIRQEIGDRAGEGKTLNGLGLVYYSQGQYVQALECFQQALVIVQEVGDRAGEGTTLNNIGLTYHAQGQYAQAIDNYQQALSMAREVGDQVGEGRALNNLGGIYDAQGLYAQTLENYQQALSIYRDVGDRAGEGTALNNIGAVYAEQGQYAQALEYYQQALSIAQEVGDQASEGMTLNNIGGVYTDQGQDTQALDYYQQALVIAQKVGNRADEGRALNHLGGIYSVQGLYAQALDNYQQALSRAREVGDRVGEGTTLNSIGTVYTHQGQYTQALDYYQQALSIRREVDRAGEGATLNRLGLVYYLQGQYAPALDYYQQALTIEQEVGDRAGEGATLTNLGGIYDSQGQYTQALEYFQQSIAIFEELRAIAGNDAARTSFIAQYAYSYQIAAFDAHQLKQDEQAFAISEQGRARSFLDALTTGAVEISDQPAAELVAREQETYAGWLAAQDVLSKAKAQNPPDPALISNLVSQLLDAEQAHTNALQAIEARDDELVALVPARSTVLSLTDLQGLLDDQTTLVSYFVIDDDSGALAFIITHDSFSVVELPNATPAKLKTAVESLTVWPSLQDAHPQPLQDLYAWLVAPIKDQIKTPLVGIIPHLTLHYIPFAALSDGKTYFGEQYQLFELPSANSLRYIQQHAAQATNSGAVVFGNPATKETGLPILPYAAAEADAVATTLGVSDYTGTAATESQLHETVNNMAIIHMAAHGAYNQHNPLYSALYLAPGVDGQYDGRLEVHEIFGLNLKGSQLVVLSACETQLGQLSTGDEVVGMTRAFMFAGAPSVLASLWRVDDEATQTLMTAFYKHWREDGMNKAQALQAAQTDVRANPKWHSPYYWAAFVLSGDVQTYPLSTTTPSIPKDSWLRINLASMVGGGMLRLVCLCGGLGVFLLMILFIGRRVLRHRGGQ